MMEENIKDSGKMESNMAKVNFINLIKKYGRKVFGVKEDVFPGKILMLPNNKN